MAEAPPRTAKKLPPSAVDFGVFRGLRAVVAMEPGISREKLATALTDAGAEVVQTNPSGDRLRRAAALDPQIVFVDADALTAPGPGGQLVTGNGLRLGRALSSNPRLRWAQVVRFSSYGFAEPNPKDPTLVRLAVESRPRIQADLHVKERARKDPPFVMQIARLGPNRLLRALASVDSPVRLTVCGPRTLAQIDLAAGTIAGAVWKEVKPERLALEGLDALAAFLMVEHGEVRIERRDVVALSNLGMPLTDAIREACARIPAVTDMVPRERFAEEGADDDNGEVSASGASPMRLSNMVRPEDVVTDATFVSAPFSEEGETSVDDSRATTVDGVTDTVVDARADALSDAHTRITAEPVADDQVTRIADNPTAALGEDARTTLRRDATPSQVSLRTILAPRMRKPSPPEATPLPPTTHLTSVPSGESVAKTLPPPPVTETEERTTLPVAATAAARAAGNVTIPRSPGVPALASVPSMVFPSTHEGAPGYLSELPLVLGTPKDAIDPSAAYRLRDPMREPTGPLRVREPSVRVHTAGTYERLTPTELVRAGAAAGSMAPPFRPLPHESPWVRALPATAFVVGGVAIAITLLLIRVMPESTNQHIPVTLHSVPVSPKSAAATVTTGSVTEPVRSEVTVPPAAEQAAVPAPSAPATVVMDSVATPKPRSKQAVTEAPATESATAPVEGTTAELPPEGEPVSAVDEAARLEDEGEVMRAEETLLAALRDDASDVLVVEALARLCLKQHRDLDAVRWAKRAVELSPDGVTSNMLLGDALGQSGEMDAARVHWEYADEQRAKAKKSNDHEQASPPAP